MKSILLISTLSTALSCAPSAVLAQMPPTTPPPRVVDATVGLHGLDEVEREAHRRQLRAPGGEVIDRESLANRVAALVDEGKCREAQALARSEGDRDMSRRVGRICREGQPAAAPRE